MMPRSLYQRLGKIACQAMGSLSVELLIEGVDGIDLSGILLLAKEIENG